MKSLIMALDQGTTSSRCILFDQKGNICSIAQKEFTQHYPKPGWVEHDPLEIWSSQLSVAVEALSKCSVNSEPVQIAAIGITNQRETTVIWDRKTGEPVYPAIVWQCRRTASMVDGLVREGYGLMIQSKTGLVPDAYFSATKIAWILDNVPDARARAERGELLFGTIDSWLIWKLTGGKVHVTDVTNASRTMLFNIHTLKWDEEILKLLNIPACILPRVCMSSEIYGTTDCVGLPAGIPIAGAAGDQQAALFGQCCFEKGNAKNTYGTGCFLLMNTGTTPVQSQNGLITTVAIGYNGQVQYALEGSVFIAGAAVQWLRDELELIRSAGESEEYARLAGDTQGAYVVPAFTGLGAPYWDQYARGVVVGLTRGFGKKHFVRAVLESIAYQTSDILHAMEQDCQISITDLKVDGGASANDFLMEFQADILDKAVLRPGCIETTALGAAYLAGLAVGYWKNTEDIKKNWALDRTFMPHMTEETRIKLLAGWKKAVKLAFHWAEE
jgi:glycerol kinase